VTIQTTRVFRSVWEAEYCGFFTWGTSSDVEGKGRSQTWGSTGSDRELHNPIMKLDKLILWFKEIGRGKSGIGDLCGSKVRALLQGFDYISRNFPRVETPRAITKNSTLVSLSQ
jgi:hypothetical protein